MSNGRLRIINIRLRASGTVAHYKHGLAFPCFAYKATVPVQSDQPLNLFELTILKLVALRPGTPAELSGQTCLPIDLVRFVLNRLTDNGQITKRREITKAGESILGTLASQKPQYGTRTLFRDAIGGKLLPAILDGPLVYSEILDGFASSRFVRIQQDSAGNAKPRRLRLIDPVNWQTNSTPSGDEVLWVVRRQRALSEQFTQLQSDSSSVARRVEPKQVEVSPDCELVYLPCDFVMQAGSTDFRISDPFGYGMSDLLESSYRKLIGTSPAEDEFVRERKERSLTNETGRKDLSNESDDSVIAIFGQGLWNFDELRTQIRKGETAWLAAAHKPTSYDQEQILRSAKQNVVVALCSSIEWALHYGVTGAHRSSVENLLLAGDFRDNQLLLEKLARKIGFSTKRCDNLLGVDPGTIRSVRFGNNNLKPLLALAIVAASSDPLHPFHQIAEKMPNWLAFLIDLKKARDASAHGDNPDLSQAELSAFRSGVYQVLPLLLPSLTPVGSDASQIAMSESERSILNRRLAVRISLEKEFGVQQFALFEEQFAELLMQAEQHCTGIAHGASQDLDAAFLVNTLSSILQILFFDLITAHRQSPSSENKINVRDAEERLRMAGFVLDRDKLPRSLSTVNPRSLAAALNQLSPSLGAVVLGASILVDEAVFKNLASSSPNMLAVVDRLLGLRQHGNRRIDMPGVKMVELKNEVFDICRCLLETC